MQYLFFPPIAGSPLATKFWQMAFSVALVTESQLYPPAVLVKLLMQTACRQNVFRALEHGFEMHGSLLHAAGSGLTGDMTQPDKLHDAV